MRVLLAALAATLILAAPASAASPDIVISQVYGGGGNAGATLKNDFIELYNRGSAPVSVAGWSVQYGSSGGTTWTNRTPLTGTIRPGRHYLVQEAAGTGGTQDLPTPNATGSIAMAAGAGKVALVTNNTNLTCAADCDHADGVRDFVGYGAANDFETAPAPLLSNTTSDSRDGAGTDTDNNAVDFTAGAPNPRNTPPPVQVTDTDPDNGANDVPVDTNVTITFDAPVDLGPDNFGISCTTSGAHGFTLSGGPTTYTLDPASDFAGEERCTVSVHTDDVDTSFSFATVGVQGLKIHDIQGGQHISPYAARIVSGVPGVVTTSVGNGFYIQDPSPDSDERTSEGVFVFSGTGGAKPPAGTAVTVSGRIQEFRPGATGLTITEIASPTVTPTGTAPVPAPTVIGDGGRIPPNRVIDNDSPVTSRATRCSIRRRTGSTSTRAWRACSSSSTTRSRPGRRTASARSRSSATTAATPACGPRAAACSCGRATSTPSASS